MAENPSEKPGNSGGYPYKCEMKIGEMLSVYFSDEL
jgi:hypothetical protein